MNDPRPEINELDELTPAFVKALGVLTFDQLVSRLGLSSRTETTHAAGQGYWKPGDGPPPMEFDGPVDANAAGRCVVNRIRFGAPTSKGFAITGKLGTAIGSIHPTACSWCDYPTDKLLAALDHATWRSQFIVSEFAVWVFRDNATYRRPTGRTGEYENPVWAEFYAGATTAGDALSPSEKHRHRERRREAIATAAGYLKPVGAR